MNCENKVPYYVVRGYSTREIVVQCGRTNPYGERAICHKCASNPRKMAEIQRHEDNIKADNHAATSAGWGEY